jgi:hypothetical protein
MVTVQVQFDEEVPTLLRAEAKARMKPVSELIRVAVGKWLVNHRCLRQEQLNDAGRLIPEEPQRKTKRRRARKDADGEATSPRSTPMRPTQPNSVVPDIAPPRYCVSISTHLR